MMANYSIMEMMNDPRKRAEYALELEEARIMDLKRRKLELEGAALVQEIAAQENAVPIQVNESPEKTMPAPDCGPKINGPIFAKLMQVIEAFPLKYPEYKTNPPKLDEDVRPWMVKSFGCTKSKEAHVFGMIVKEHFKLKG